MPTVNNIKRSFYVRVYSYYQNLIKYVTLYDSGWTVLLLPYNALHSEESMYTYAVMIADELYPTARLVFADVTLNALVIERVSKWIFAICPSMLGYKNTPVGFYSFGGFLCLFRLTFRVVPNHPYRPYATPP